MFEKVNICNLEFNGKKKRYDYQNFAIMKWYPFSPWEKKIKTKTDQSTKKYYNFNACWKLWMNWNLGSVDQGN